MSRIHASDHRWVNGLLRGKQRLRDGQRVRDAAGRAGTVLRVWVQELPSEFRAMALVEFDAVQGETGCDETGTLRFLGPAGPRRVTARMRAFIPINERSGVRFHAHATTAPGGDEPPGAARS